jgi:hypothetical protein
MPCFYWTEAFQYQPLVESTVHAFRLQPAYTKLVSTVSLMRRTSTSLLTIACTCTVHWGFVVLELATSLRYDTTYVEMCH